MDNPKQEQPFRRPNNLLLGDGGWYVQTRERINIGPFASRHHAAEAAGRTTEPTDEQRRASFQTPELRVDV
jgi:hypothetical protein